MYSFAYHRAKNVKDAVALLKKADEGKLLAGGQTLIPTLKQRLAGPGAIIDIGGVKELSGIALKGKTLVIGALTRHAEVATSKVVRKALPALADLAEAIGDPAVRNLGTIGGSIANNDPAADYPAACLGLGATIVTSKRKIPADKFFKGLFETALGDDEIITQVVFPLAKHAAYAKFPNPASRYALVGVFVSKNGSDVRVAVTGASENGVFRVADMERALKKNFSAKALDGISVKPRGLNSDIHGSAEYRAHLIGVMARRAVAAAA
jgi:carbon-monoxide dehydrogenase medium subunit